MESSSITVLVTGANGGLGLGICLRLVDDFLKTRTAAGSLNIIYTTRSTRKGSDTLKTLQAHLHRYHPSSQHSRVTFQAENAELTNLLSVRRLARKLVDSELKSIDAIVCNAGIGAWIGFDWFAAVPAVLADIRNNTTWPTYKLGTVGSVTNSQLQDGKILENPLGEVFCANVFGHYMLVHWLMSLLRACDSASPAKVIWVSSIEPQSYHFNARDLQGLSTDAPYESSKRLTDLLALTSNQPTASRSINSFTSPASSTKSSSAQARSDNGKPTIHVYHPGIVVTAVVTLFWIVHQAYLLSIYLARWAGAPWSTVEPYTAAHGATWLALSSEEEIRTAEMQVQIDAGMRASNVEAGKVKWGTAVTRTGKTTVRPSEVDKWGINGSGMSFAEQWWGEGKGRKPGAIEAKPEDVQEFVAQGTRAWEQMEDLRVEWERIIAKSEEAR